ncbi:YggS family pyridoxal phosphate-dependent enzyme [Niabella beijingensis]|uniref:YggS family pyridoxal phosphate-dependent enzyme n=1 Tax=Niabella beijingensis TaxID=2872700 RepID=UPI001CBD763A|nr:YggS family pyridoxal phosphate-dependent enzyme [Niabella beijingensis]MBZ4187300.1 YggS family pyridoxal phosphate-dependent enzyme [Niabella beijingensis]
MSVNERNYKEILARTEAAGAVLVAVSKVKPVSDIKALYDLGQRDFGENYVQELVEKQALLPGDIRWHFIGHLQSNKVKYIAPFVHLIHGVDSFKLLEEIDKQAAKNNRVIDCLLQVHVAQEATKFGFDSEEVVLLLDTIDKYKQLNKLQHVNICGLMAMASFTDDLEKLKQEFATMKALSEKNAERRTLKVKPETLSMGMSGDYELALEYGSTMIRVGSLLFGARG